jgi:hypothetical protein
MRLLLPSLILASALASAAPVAAQSGSRDTGIVAWDRKAQTLWLGQQSYLVPNGVSTRGMSSGDTVTVTWLQQGSQRVATSIRLPVPKSSEAKDKLSNAGLPQFDALLGQGNRKPVRPLGLEPFRALDRAVAVGVRLNHGHILDVGADKVSDRTKVKGQIVEIDLSPGGSSRFCLRHW